MIMALVSMRQLLDHAARVALNGHCLIDSLLRKAALTKCLDTADILLQGREEAVE